MYLPFTAIILSRQYCVHYSNCNVNVWSCHLWMQALHADTSVMEAMKSTEATERALRRS